MKKSSLWLLLILTICALSICVTAADPVYVDGTGAAVGAYATLEDAIAALPNDGGTVIVCGNTTVGTSSSSVTLPAKNGKVTITSEGGAKLTIAYGLKLGGETEFDGIELVNSSDDMGFICAMGNKLTIRETVTTSITNSSDRWLSLYGGNNDSGETTTYDSHMIIQAGKWRYIYGGSKGFFNGNSILQVSEVTTNVLSAGNENGNFHGTALLIVDLRGNKTVTASDYDQTPFCITDDGYKAVFADQTYSQVREEKLVYLDGTGVTAGAYATLEDAIAALSNDGGTVIVCGDTTVGTSSSSVTLPAKNGKVTITSEGGAKLTIDYGLKLGGETEFDGIELVNSSGSMGFICAMGNKLTISETVTTSITNSSNRWLSLYGGNNVSGETTSYDAHMVIKAGKWRHIYGGSKGTFNGDATVEVSNITVTNNLSAKNEEGSFKGTATLTVNLCGDKTVTAGTYVQTPTFVTDAGYMVALDGKTYSQIEAASGDIYVDGTGATEGAYRTLEEAVAVLPNEGGTITVCGDTTVGSSSSSVTLPAKNGKVTITSEGGAKLTIAFGLKLGGETEFDGIELVNSSGSMGFICAMGNKLTISETVTTSITNSSDRWLSLYGGNNVSGETTSYDAHMVIKAGKWRHIYGGSKGTFNGDATVEVSGITVTNNLSAKNEAGSFNGTGTLIVNLCGDKTVTAGTYAQTPALVTDAGYTVVLTGNTYSQTRAETDSAYVDGTGATAGAYRTLEDAIAVLPNEGGTVTVCGDTTVGTASTSVTLPAKGGKVTITGENGAKLMIAYGIKLGSETEFSNIELVNTSEDVGYIAAYGNKLTVGETVTTSKENTERWLSIYGGSRSSETTSYDTHVIVKAGTWRYIFGGHNDATFNGDSVVEVSGAVVERVLSAKNESGTFSGTATLIVDLRGNKTVTAGTYAQTPAFLTDDGYTAVLNGSVYSQEKAVVPGDANCDGKLSVADVLFILREILNDGTAESADVTGDGRISLVDVMRVMRWISQGTPAPDEGSRLYTIDELNTESTPWSHVDEDINTANLEISYRDAVKLDSEMLRVSWAKSAAMYPRIQKLKDDLYLMTYMHGQYGGEALYYITSADGKNWTEPAVLWKLADTGGKFVHTEGKLEGKSDSYIGVNPDFCVLQNGDILAVYYLRPKSGYNYPLYEPYQRLSGVHMKRGTVGADNTITWGEDQKLTYGRGWEPTVWQRPDGRIEIFWTNASTGLLRYEDAHWSSVGMIYSTDNGFTWTPDREAGLENEYLYLNIFQEVTDKHLPTAVYPDGTPWFTEPQPFAKGQMPSVTHLYNGRTLLATEARPYDGPFHITLATSLDGGEWQHVDFSVDATGGTDAIAGDKSPTGAAPDVSTFPSGEVYLVYNQGLMQRGRLVRADGKELSMHEYTPSPAAYNAFWGCCAVVDSHKALSAIHDEEHNIHIFTSYLNHRINAKFAGIKVDGGTDDWRSNTDAFFVGSDSQAQVTLRVAHDETNVYFLLSLLDEYLTSEDAVTVCVAEAALSDRRITVRLDGSAILETYWLGEKQTASVLNGRTVVTKGTVDNNTDKDDGAVIEIAVPKADLALEEASEMAVRLVLTNNDGDGSITDSFAGVHTMYTAYWPKVVLD